ncbi:MAG TPA: hypothetical protein VFG91_00535, partial [Woeseiaceae bacterium]|nr:hypothetical protein [Woeseiaceae bacterium]
MRISSDVSGAGRASRAGAFLAPVLALALSAGPVSAIAQEPPPEPPPITQPTPLSQVGETVLNPANGQEVVIAQVIADNSGQNAYVLTESLEMILTR